MNMLLDNIDWKERISFPHFLKYHTHTLQKENIKNWGAQLIHGGAGSGAGFIHESLTVMYGVCVTKLTTLLPHILNLSFSWHPPCFAPQSVYLNTFIFLQDISCVILHMHLYFKWWQSCNNCMWLNLLPVQKTKSRIYASKWLFSHTDYVLHNCIYIKHLEKLVCEVELQFSI